MTTRPLHLRAHEVHGILDGRLTQIRRPIKPQPMTDSSIVAQGDHFLCGVNHIWCRPFGAVGDSLWCREAWGWLDEDKFADPRWMVWRASAEPLQPSPRWRSSSTMPQWASRITIEVLDIRAHRLQDVTIGDIRASGTRLHVAPDENDPAKARPLICITGKYPMGDYLDDWQGASLDDYYRAEFASQWDKDYAKTAPWPSNPWVFAATVKRVT